MANERKISKLESELSDLKIHSSYGSNCIEIARIEIQLSYYYAKNGNKSRSDELILDAKKVLNDPLCIGGKEKDSLLNYIENINPQTGLPNQIQIPALFRYLSLIILFIGYLLIYFASIFIKNFTNTEYITGILVVFMISIFINPLIRAKYVNRSRNRQV